MKLIDENLIKAFAMQYEKERLGLPAMRYEAVCSGVDFAEQQLKQKMIEFADWMKEQPILICQTTNGHQWSSSYMGGGYYTSEQLLEEFINQQK